MIVEKRNVSLCLRIFTDIYIIKKIRRQQRLEQQSVRVASHKCQGYILCIT